MADFEAPSFSLGLDCDLFDSEPQICTVSRERDPSSSNQLPVAAAALEDEHDEFETLVVDDSEPEDPDPHPKLKRLRRGPLSSVPAKAEFRSRAPVDDEDIEVFYTQEDRRGDARVAPQHNAVSSSSISSCNDLLFPKLTIRRFQSIDSDSVSDDPSVSGECIRSMKDRKNSQSNAAKSYVDFGNPLPAAHRYFLHENPMIRELVRTRLPNFSPLGYTRNKDCEQPSVSNIDYMGQFSFDQSSKQAARNNKVIKDSNSRKNSRKSKNDEASQGWINPKLGVEKRKLHASGQSAGHWLTNPNGKKVYLCKNGQELTGRVAYNCYRKERGGGFKKSKRKSASKKKK